ncbi:Splicing factor 3A subunit 3 [Cichlidogyrus casuarinus]|uniref:Splicing factor 3A subunit 3 n=1 Tax=Cichlidogyrus casuarinus TaxID=1844966 RepID=A0ABD2Q5B5_9PLAT
METILEHQRKLHEESERVVVELTRELSYQPPSHYFSIIAKIIELYEDEDGLRKADIQALSGPNEFDEFYKRLKMIKDFHHIHPGEISVPLSIEYDKFKELRENHLEAGATIIEFSDEEGYGRFLDLYEVYDKYINLKGIIKLDYLSYLRSFERLFEVARDKKNQQYKEYLESLIIYLEGFLARAKPMVDLRSKIKSALEEFEEKWVNSLFPGWQKDSQPAISHSGAHLDLTAFTSSDELASLGLDRLKSALMAIGLKCGGTLEERANRLWATKGVPLNQLPPELFAGKAKVARETSQFTERQKEIGATEASVYVLAKLVKEERDATVDNIQRKQARGPQEREEDDWDLEESAAIAKVDGNGEGEDEDDVPYNPKNLPLGWDGKPIPYWLYKLHGLNMYYSCEICGNQTYRGPKAFQRHFSEWRHAHGMRCLGIPNTAHFAHITKIEDALALWQTIRQSKEKERWRPEIEEEMEDSAGNVVSRKTYEDLKRQGLL